MTFDYDCRCPICDARARGVWPAFVEPESDLSAYEIDMAARAGHADDPYKALGDRIDAAMWDGAIDLGFYP